MKHKNKWLTPKGRLRTKFLSSLSFDSLLKLYKETENESLLNYIVNSRFKRKLKGKWKGITKKDYILFRTGKAEIELCDKCKRYYKTKHMLYCNVCKNYINTKESVQQKYGVDNVSKLDNVKQKKVETWSKNKDKWIKKHKQTIQRKYGVNNISQIEFVKAKRRKSNRKATKVNSSISFDNSYLETYFYEYLLSEHNIKVLRKYQELDLYLPDYNLGIECQGLLWHSNDNAFIRDKNKFETYTNKGVRLFYVYEDDFQTKKHILIDMLNHKLNLNKDKKIYARNCQVHITNKISNEIKEFFNRNHIHGFIPGSEYIVLIHNNEIISGMILIPNRFSSNKKELEIGRFCNKVGYVIPGSFSKCLYHSKLKSKFKHITFFIDSSFGSNIFKDIKSRYSFLNPKSISKTETSFYVVDLDNNVKYHRLSYDKYPSKIFRPFSWKLITTI